MAGDIARLIWKLRRPPTEAAQFSFLRSFLMISRSSFAYSSVIRRSSCGRESLGFGTFSSGSGGSVAFIANGS